MSEMKGKYVEVDWGRSFREATQAELRDGKELYAAIEKQKRIIAQAQDYLDLLESKCSPHIFYDTPGAIGDVRTCGVCGHPMGLV